MDSIEVSQMRVQVERIATSYIDVKVEIVDDIAKWCAANSGGQYSASELDNPIGKALWNSPSEPNRILLRATITGSQVDDHLLVLFIKGFKDVYYRIPSSVTFLKHLVLHEVAHIKNNWQQEHEDDCDRWAFEQLESWAEP